MKRYGHRERVQTVVIGAGQSGLSTGYYLSRKGLPFVILDANERVGDVWRHRWDSLRLFTPARYCGLAGYPFPLPAETFPTKDQMADYLEDYASRFGLPVRNRMCVSNLTREEGRYIISAGHTRFEADNVVIAMSSYQTPRLPSFVGQFNPQILQMHSKDYRRPSQLNDGGVLVVGAGNSGAEIAMDVARSHKTWLAGRDTGTLPFRIDGAPARLFLRKLLFRVVFHRILTVKTPIGRKLQADALHRAAPLIRVKPADLEAAGVLRVPRVEGVRGGLPLLEDGRTLDVQNVIWSTGYNPGFSWIQLPGFGDDGVPKHDAGAATDYAGLYFVGLPFTYAFSSAMIHGVARDAERVASMIASDVRARAEARMLSRAVSRAAPAA